jgi:hypothetical protein
MKQNIYDSTYDLNVAIIANGVRLLGVHILCLVPREL